MVPHVEAAKYLGISRVSLWKLVNEGEIKVYQDKLDKRKKLYRLSDLNKLKGVREVS
jgi:hypothetical protein